MPIYYLTSETLVWVNIKINCNLLLYLHQIKCVQYWPSTNYANYGDITVEILEDHFQDDTVTSKFKVMKVRQAN